MAVYTARRGAVTRAVLWRVTGGGEQHVLPDGVMDLMWMEERLVVAGPDTVATFVGVEEGTEVVGLLR